MAKQNGKKITVDGLARIINKGFDEQMKYMKEEFAKVATKEQVRQIDERLKNVEKVLTDAHVLT